MNKGVTKRVPKSIPDILVDGRTGQLIRSERVPCDAMRMGTRPRGQVVDKGGFFTTSATEYAIPMPATPIEPAEPIGLNINYAQTAVSNFNAGGICRAIVACLVIAVCIFLVIVIVAAVGAI